MTYSGSKQHARAAVAKTVSRPVTFTRPRSASGAGGGSSSKPARRSIASNASVMRTPSAKQLQSEVQQTVDKSPQLSVAQRLHLDDDATLQGGDADAPLAPAVGSPAQVLQPATSLETDATTNPSTPHAAQPNVPVVDITPEAQLPTPAPASLLADAQSPSKGSGEKVPVPALKWSAAAVVVTNAAPVGTPTAAPPSTMSSRPVLVSPVASMAAATMGTPGRGTPGGDACVDGTPVMKKRGLSLIFQAAATLTSRDTASILRKDAHRVTEDDDDDEDEDEDGAGSEHDRDVTAAAAHRGNGAASSPIVTSSSHTRDGSGFVPPAPPPGTPPAGDAVRRVRAAAAVAAKASPKASESSASINVGKGLTSEEELAAAPAPPAAPVAASFNPRVSATARLAALALGSARDSDDEDDATGVARTGRMAGTERAMTAEMAQRAAAAEQPSLASVVKAITFARSLASKAKEGTKRRASDNAEKIAGDVANITAAQKFARVMRDQQRRRMSAPDASLVKAALLFGESGAMDSMLSDEAAAAAAAPDMTSEDA